METEPESTRVRMEIEPESERVRMDIEPESERVRMEIEPEYTSSQEVTENMKESCLATVFWAIICLESVPKIALIQMTKKLVKNSFLNKFGHKGQI